MKQFSAVDQPYMLPDDMNIFEWSLPFLADKVITMLSFCVQQVSRKDLKNLDQDEKDQIAQKFNDDVSKESEKLQRKIEIRRKLKNFVRMNEGCRRLVENAQHMLELKQYSPDGKINREVYLSQKPRIDSVQKNFDLSTKLDVENEKRPKTIK